MFWVVQLEQSPDAFYCWQRAHTHDDVGVSTCVCARVCSVNVLRGEGWKSGSINSFLRAAAVSNKIACTKATRMCVCVCVSLFT